MIVSGAGRCVLHFFVVLTQTQQDKSGFSHLVSLVDPLRVHVRYTNQVRLVGESVSLCHLAPMLRRLVLTFLRNGNECRPAITHISPISYTYNNPFTNNPSPTNNTTKTTQTNK